MVPATDKKWLDQLLQKHPEIQELFIDWTERPVQRDQDYETQEEKYSGKKKRHTLKNIVITSNTKMIVALSITEWWKKHDYQILKESWFLEVLMWYVLRVDSWFQWILTDYSWLNVNIPKKNYKNKPLTQDDKDSNYLISMIRVIIENIIWWAKKYRIIANKYRNRTYGNFWTVKSNRKHKVMLIVCWLYNLRQSWVIS